MPRAFLITHRRYNTVVEYEHRGKLIYVNFQNHICCCFVLYSKFKYNNVYIFLIGTLNSVYSFTITECYHYLLNLQINFLSKAKKKKKKPVSNLSLAYCNTIIFQLACN